MNRQSAIISVMAMVEHVIDPERFWHDVATGAGALPADVRRLGELLDDRWRLPGTRIRFGLDSVIGLIPGIGDTVGLLLGAYIVLRAHQLGAGMGLKLRMLANLFVDWLIGLLPLLGDIMDVGFKANRRNVALLQKQVQQTMRSTA